MLAVAYILQQNRAIVNKTHNTRCPLCESAEENIPYFLVTCQAVSAVRDLVLETALNQVPFIYEQHPIEAGVHNRQSSWY